MAHNSDSSLGSDAEVSDTSNPVALPLLTHTIPHSSAPLISSPHLFIATLSHANPGNTTPNLHTTVAPNNSVSKCATLYLRANPDSHSRGLFKHFTLTSHQDNLADISHRDKQCRDDIKSEKIDQALTTIEQKVKKTEAARLHKCEQRAREKSQVFNSFYFIEEHY